MTFMSTTNSRPLSLMTKARTEPRPSPKASEMRDQRLDWSMTGMFCLTSPLSVMATTNKTLVLINEIKNMKMGRVKNQN